MVYVGLELDVAVGRHDGIVQGKRYFTAKPSHGLMVPIRDTLAILSKKLKPEVVAMANRLSSIRALRHSSDANSSGLECSLDPLFCMLFKF